MFQLDPSSAFGGQRLARYFLRWVKNPRNAGRPEQIRLYKKFASLPSTRKMAGNVFEAYCQQVFCKHISMKKFRWRFECMEEQVSTSVAHFQYGSFPPQLLGNKRLAILRKGMSLNIHPHTSVEYLIQIA